MIVVVVHHGPLAVAKRRSSVHQATELTQELYVILTETAHARGP